MYTDYPKFVSKPMDLSTMMFNLRRGEYDGPEGRESLLSDLDLIPSNCEKYNGKRMEITVNSRRIALAFRRLYRSWVEGSKGADGDLLDDTCSACGVHLDKGMDDARSCTMCLGLYHASCVDAEDQAEEGWVCPDCAGQL
ncbi:unnamed protein product [Discosporangium mesarthrocarpum]